MKKCLSSWSILFLFFFVAVSLPAAEVKIGALYPMSGPVAQGGLDAKNAIELALDIINTDKYKHLNLPLSKTVGLPNLQGAKMTVTISDHQGKPDLGLSESERLITQEKAVALFGCYHSAVTDTASMVAERMKIPFFAPESTAPKLTRRGFKWFFRSTPTDDTFSEAMFKCLRDLEKKRGAKFKTLAVVYEDTLYGKESSLIEKRLAAEAGYNVVADLSYRRAATSLTSETQRLKAANPEVVFFSSYTSDAILFCKTFKELDYNPSVILAQNAGHTDPTFADILGKDADGISSRGEFALDLVAYKPMLKEVNDLLKKRSGRDFSGPSS